MPRRPFPRHLLRAIPVIVIVSALTFAADRLHLLDSLHYLAMDVFVASAAAPPAPSIVIVNISDEDYRALFNDTSPLDRQTLGRLITTVAKAKPAVIGVDITTAVPGDITLQQSVDGLDVPIVWARDAYPPDPAAGRREWQVGPVLGMPAPPPEIRVGLSLFPRDADRFIRGYYRRVPDVQRPTLAWAMLDAYCQDTRREGCVRIRVATTEEHAGTDDERVEFNFAADGATFRKVNAGAVAAAPPEVFADKLVLIGGTFAAGRDFYATPLGEMAGVELTARAVQSELRGGGLTGLNEVLMVAVDLLGGIALVYLNWRVEPGTRLNAIVCGSAIMLFAMVGSYLAFRAFSYWATFVPVGVGVWLHECYDRAREAGALRRELEALRHHAKS